MARRYGRHVQAATVHIPTGGNQSAIQHVMSWVRLAVVTLPLFIVWMVAAVVHDLALRAWQLVRPRAATPQTETAAEEQPASSVLVPAEIWAQPGISVGQDGESLVDRG
jgi:hypothetical protein